MGRRLIGNRLVLAGVGGFALVAVLGTLTLGVWLSRSTTPPEVAAAAHVAKLPERPEPPAPAATAPAEPPTNSEKPVKKKPAKPEPADETAEEKPADKPEVSEPPAATASTGGGADDGIKTLEEWYPLLAPGVPLILSKSGSGSGILVENHGKYFVVTNRHVIAGSPENEVVFVIGQSRSQAKSHSISGKNVRVTAIHRRADLALLAIDASPTQLQSWKVKSLRLATKAEMPGPGAEVFAIGHPGGQIPGETLLSSITGGEVSAVGYQLPDGLDKEVGRLIQITVPINWGNSGGPLFDRRGRVIGVNTIAYRFSGGQGDMPLQGINFAIEVAHVHELLNSPSASLSSKDIESILNPDPADELLAIVRKAAKEYGFDFYGGSEQSAIRQFALSTPLSVFPMKCRRNMQYAIIAAAPESSVLNVTVHNEAGDAVAESNENLILQFATQSGGDFTIWVASGKGSSEAGLLFILQKKN